MDKQLYTLDMLKNQSGFEKGSFTQFLAFTGASLLFSLLLSFSHRLYLRRGEAADLGVRRSFPLLGPAVTSVFWVIRFSLPLSLGLLGALSFVRFRTPVKRAEDIAFILILIAGALACSVGFFMVAGVLLAVTLIYGFVRTRASLDSAGTAVLTVRTAGSAGQVAELEQVLRSRVKRAILLSSSHVEGTHVLSYQASLRTGEREALLKDLQTKEPKMSLDVFYSERV